MQSMAFERVFVGQSSIKTLQICGVEAFGTEIDDLVSFRFLDFNWVYAFLDYF